MLDFGLPRATSARMEIMWIAARERRQVAAFLQRPDHSRNIVIVSHDCDWRYLDND